MAFTKEAAKWVMATLTDVDRVSLVGYGSNAYKFSTTLVKPGKISRRQMSMWIDNLAPLGRTNMAAAFTAAFEIFGSASSGSATTGCSKILLFLTDGENSGVDPKPIINQHNSGPYVLSSPLLLFPSMLASSWKGHCWQPSRARSRK